MANRTTNVLLGFITLALVGLLVRSYLTTAPVLASDTGAAQGEGTWIRVPSPPNDAGQSEIWLNLTKADAIGFTGSGSEESANVAMSNSAYTVGDPAQIRTIRAFLLRRGLPSR